ncbi:MAG: hypothetical protein WDO19_03880 [Bacteroidota bacterium]
MSESISIMPKVLIRIITSGYDWDNVVFIRDNEILFDGYTISGVVVIKILNTYNSLPLNFINCTFTAEISIESFGNSSQLQFNHCTFKGKITFKGLSKQVVFADNCLFSQAVHISGGTGLSIIISDAELHSSLVISGSSMHCIIGKINKGSAKKGSIEFQRGQIRNLLLSGINVTSVKFTGHACNQDDAQLTGLDVDKLEFNHFTLGGVLKIYASGIKDLLFDNIEGKKKGLRSLKHPFPVARFALHMLETTAITDCHTINTLNLWGTNGTDGAFSVTRSVISELQFENVLK